MRLMLFRIESTWSWFALISSGESAPVLAAWLVSALDFQQQAADFAERAFGRVDHVAGAGELSIAWLMPAISLRSVSLAISPAGCVLAAVDLQTGAQTLQAGGQIASDSC